MTPRKKPAAAPAETFERPVGPTLDRYYSIANHTLEDYVDDEGEVIHQSRDARERELASIVLRLIAAVRTLTSELYQLRYPAMPAGRRNKQ